MPKTLSAKYHQENEERLQKKARERYKTLSKEEKGKKQRYGCERYKNLSEDEKKMLVEHRKKYYRMRKKYLIIKNNDLEYNAISLLKMKKKNRKL